MTKQNSSTNRTRLLSAVLILGIISVMSSGYGQSEGDIEMDHTKRVSSSEGETVGNRAAYNESAFTADTSIRDVIDYPGFDDYGRLIFPVNDGYYGGNTLGTMSLTWYSNIQPRKTVEIANYLKGHADTGNIIFYDIYTKEEKKTDPGKKDIGLFFSKGIPEKNFPSLTRVAALFM